MDSKIALPADPPGLATADLTERMAHAMAAAAHAYAVALVRELAKRGYDDLTPSSARLLSRIDPGGSRATNLAQILRRTKQAVGQTVIELELRGYVERVPDPLDARAQLIRRTRQGADVLAAALEIRRQLDAMTSEVLDTKELLAIERGLERLTTMMRSEDPDRS